MTFDKPVTVRLDDATAKRYGLAHSRTIGGVSDAYRVYDVPFLGFDGDYVRVMIFGVGPVLLTRDKVQGLTDAHVEEKKKANRKEDRRQLSFFDVAERER